MSLTGENYLDYLEQERERRGEEIILGAETREFIKRMEKIYRVPFATVLQDLRESRREIEGRYKLNKAKVL